MVHRSGWESRIPDGNPAELVEGSSLLDGPVALDAQPSTRCWQRFQEDPMAKITRAAPHLSAGELTMQWKLDPHSWRRPRWLIISHALVNPREATEIARHTSTTVAMVHQAIASYNREGVAAVETKGERWSPPPVYELGRRTGVFSSLFSVMATWHDRS